MKYSLTDGTFSNNFYLKFKSNLLWSDLDGHAIDWKMAGGKIIRKLYGSVFEQTKTWKSWGKRKIIKEKTTYSPWWKINFREWKRRYFHYLKWKILLFEIWECGILLIDYFGLYVWEEKSCHWKIAFNYKIWYSFKTNKIYLTINWNFEWELFNWLIYRLIVDIVTDYEWLNGIGSNKICNFNWFQST